MVTFAWDYFLGGGTRESSDEMKMFYVLTEVVVTQDVFLCKYSTSCISMILYLTV